MDINLMKKIFGSMPIEQLTATQQLVKKRNNTTLLVLGSLALVIGSCYIGFKIGKHHQAINQKLQK